MSRPEHSGRRVARGAGPGADSPLERELVFTREAVRRIDRAAVERYGIPSIVLMENAARGLAEVVREVLDGSDAGVVVVCGRGNNGGDGLAAARHLHNAGVAVSIVLADGTDLSADAGVNLRIDRQMGLDVRSAKESDPDGALEGAGRAVGTPGVIIDAVLGTGADRPVGGRLAAMIVAINRARERWACATVAADLPSGLDADTGEGLAQNRDELDRAVRADVTVTFVGAKRGFQTLAAQPFIGEVVVRDIGAPVELVRELGERLPASKHPGSGRRGRARVDEGAERPDRPESADR